MLGRRSLRLLNWCTAERSRFQFSSQGSLNGVYVQWTDHSLTVHSVKDSHWTCTVPSQIVAMRWSDSHAFSQSAGFIHYLLHAVSYCTWVVAVANLAEFKKKLVFSEVHLSTTHPYLPPSLLPAACCSWWVSLSSHYCQPNILSLFIWKLNLLKQRSPWKCIPQRKTIQESVVHWVIQASVTRRSRRARSLPPWQFNWTEKGTNHLRKWFSSVRSLKRFVLLNESFANDTTLLPLTMLFCIAEGKSCVTTLRCYFAVCNIKSAL